MATGLVMFSNEITGERKKETDDNPVSHEQNDPRVASLEVIPSALRRCTYRRKSLPSEEHADD